MMKNELALWNCGACLDVLPVEVIGRMKLGFSAKDTNGLICTGWTGDALFGFGGTCAVSRILNVNDPGQLEEGD